MNTNPTTRTESVEDEPNESRLMSESGADELLTMSPGVEENLFDDPDILGEASEGRESPASGHEPVTGGDRSLQFAHGFGSGTSGSLEAEQMAKTGKDSGIRHTPQEGGGPVSMGS